MPERLRRLAEHLRQLSGTTATDLDLAVTDALELRQLYTAEEINQAIEIATAHTEAHRPKGVA